MIDRRRFVSNGVHALFLPFVAGGPAQQPPQPPPTETIRLILPEGYTAHLENPQAIMDGAGVIFAATRPNSGVGGLVWKQFPDGRSELALPVDPNIMYALGEFQVWPDGYLRYIAVEKVDHTFLVVIPVPGWTPWPNPQPLDLGGGTS